MYYERKLYAHNNRPDNEHKVYTFNVHTVLSVHACFVDLSGCLTLPKQSFVARQFLANTSSARLSCAYFLRGNLASCRISSESLK